MSQLLAPQYLSSRTPPGLAPTSDTEPILVVPPYPPVPPHALQVDVGVLLPEQLQVQVGEALQQADHVPVLPPVGRRGKQPVMVGGRSSGG